jgi:hypothetical protein
MPAAGNYGGIAIFCQNETILGMKKSPRVFIATTELPFIKV